MDRITVQLLVYAQITCACRLHLTYPRSFLLPNIVIRRFLELSAILLAPHPVVGGNPALTSVVNFNSTYHQLCEGGAANSTACKSLLYNETRDHFAYTDYLNRENEAVEDVLKALENDWGFAVNQFTALDPQVSNFTATNATTMSTLVNNLSDTAQALITKVNPILSWSHKALQDLLYADSQENVNFTNASDAAIQRLLNRAMTVGQIFPHQINMYAKNSSAFADKFFNTEFFRVKNAINAKYGPLQDALKRVQQKLSNQRDYVSTQINFMNVKASQMNDTMSIEVPERLAAQRQAIIQTLRDRIAARLGGAEIQRQTALVNTQLATHGRNQSEAFNTSFYQDMDATLDQIETRMNDTILVAVKQAQEYVAKFGTSNSAGADKWEEISGLLSALTSANSDAAAQYMVSDTDFGNDSIANFLTLRDDIVGGIEGTGGAVGSLVNRAMSDLDAFAFTVRVGLGRAIDGMTTTDTNTTIQGLQEWARYTKDLYDNAFNSLMTSFEEGIQNITDAVMLRINGVTVEKGEDLASAGVKSILGSNMNMLNTSELIEQENNMSVVRNDLFRYSQDRFSTMLTTINATGRDMDLEALKRSADKSTERAVQDLDDELAKVKDVDYEVMTGIRLNQIDKPIAEAMDKFSTVRKRVQALVKRSGDITKRLVGLATDLSGTSSQTNLKITEMDTQLATRARAMENLFKQTGEEMAAAISDFVSQFVGGLPTTTGFVKMVMDREQNVTNAREYVSKTGLEIQQQIDAQATLVKNYQDRLSRADTNFATAQAEIARRDGVQAPDFVGMSKLRSLGQRFDFDQVWKRQNNTILTEVGRIDQDFKDRELLVAKALGDATKESSARDSEVADLKAKLAVRNTTFSATKDAYTVKILNTVNDVNNSMNMFDSQTREFATTMRARMSTQTQLFVQAVSDLLYQIGTSGPDFLKQYEVDRIADLTTRLKNMNDTLPSVVPSVSASLSLLHRTSQEGKTVSPSHTLVEVMQTLHNKSEIESLKSGIALKVKSIQAAIADHKEVNVTVAEEPGTDERSYVESTDSFFAKLGEMLPRLSRNVNAISNEKSATIAAFLKGNETDVTLGVDQVRRVIRNITQTERSVLHSAIREVQRDAESFNQTVAEMADLTQTVEGNTKSAPEFTFENRTNLTSTPAAYPALEKLRSWLSSFISDSQRTVDNRITRERKELNKTVSAIEKLHEKLQQMLVAEDKVESEFNSTIIPKLVERNRERNDTTELAFRAVESEIEKLHKSIRVEHVIV